MPPLAANAISIDDGHRVGERYWTFGNTSAGGQGQEVQGVPCGHMDETYHVHPHVSIFLNGNQLAFPQRVGIVDLSPTRQCIYAVHTHDQSGMIHVEAPAFARFTLGQLFAIWGQPLERNDVAGLRDMPVRVYIDERGGSVATEYELELERYREHVTGARASAPEVH